MYKTLGGMSLSLSQIFPCHSSLWGKPNISRMREKMMSLMVLLVTHFSSLLLKMKMRKKKWKI